VEDRVKEIFSPEVIDLIRRKELEGYSRFAIVSLLVNNKDKPLGELLNAYRGELTDGADVCGHTSAYRNMLIEAVLTEIGLKEEIAELQELLNQEQEESED